MFISGRFKHSLGSDFFKEILISEKGFKSNLFKKQLFFFISFSSALFVGTDNSDLQRNVHKYNSYEWRNRPGKDGKGVKLSETGKLLIRRIRSHVFSGLLQAKIIVTSTKKLTEPPEDFNRNI